MAAGATPQRHARGGPRLLWRSPYAVVLATMLVACLVRLPAMRSSLNTSDAASWWVASASSVGSFLDRLTDIENSPPLYFASLVVLPDVPEYWIRLPALGAALLTIPLLYGTVRPLLGDTAALFATLAAAVTPYYVALGSYARPFTFSDLGLMLALLAAVHLALGGSKRWWSGYFAGAAIALYAEYDAALTLVSIVASLLLLGTLPRRETMKRGLLPLLVLVPLIPLIGVGLRKVGDTKPSPPFSEPGPGAVRDVVLSLGFGENGFAKADPLRTLQFVLEVSLVVAGCVWLWRRVGSHEPASSTGVPPSERLRYRVAFYLLVGTGAFTLLLHFAIAVVGPNIFYQRYLSFVILLTLAVLAGPAAAVAHRGFHAAIVAGLLIVGIAVAARAPLNVQPLEPVAAFVHAHGHPDVLTNDPRVVYYLRDLRPVLDRPFGYTIQDPCAPRCRLPYTVVDVIEGPPGYRTAAAATTIGLYVVFDLAAGARNPPNGG